MLVRPETCTGQLTAFRGLASWTWRPLLGGEDKET